MAGTRGDPGAHASHARHKHWERNQAIVREHLDGDATRDIAARRGMTVRGTNYVLRTYRGSRTGWAGELRALLQHSKAEPGTPSRVTEAEVRQMVDLRAAGLPYTAIGEALGYAHDTIARHVSRAAPSLAGRVPGRYTRHIWRDRCIVAARRTGLAHTDIGRAFGLSAAAVGLVLQREAPELGAAWAGSPDRKTGAEFKRGNGANRERVVNLARAGMKRQAIAAELGISYAAVTWHVRQGAPDLVRSRADFADRREYIIAARREGRTSAAIARELDLHRSYVESLVKRHAPELVDSPEKQRARCIAVVRAREGGESNSNIADGLGLTRRQVANIVRRYRAQSTGWARELARDLRARA
jgi:DNA-binding NarL/FixJ family response regulator